MMVYLCVYWHKNLPLEEFEYTFLRSIVGLMNIGDFHLAKMVT